MKKNYYCRCEVAEGYPCYEFVIRAKNWDEALKIANKKLKMEFNYNTSNFSLTQVTAKGLLKRLTIN